MGASFKNSEPLGNEGRKFFGPYGGQYVPELLLPALDALEETYLQTKGNFDFQEELSGYLQDAGRPTPLQYASNLSDEIGIATYLKNEGLLHTGAHKLNNALGQALLAKKMGKGILIAETGAGQHGLATATAAAKLKLGCRVFMGEVDVERQYPNVYAMKLLGAEVIPVKEGTRTLKDAVNSALKNWIENLDDSHYIIGSALGPHPYPTIVRDFQSIIGRESRAQFQSLTGELPTKVIASVGGGSNALGIFYGFIDDPVELIAVEAGGRGIGLGEHARRFLSAKVGIAQGYKSYFIQDQDGQLQETHSISAGLDYGGIGPELSHLRDQGRVKISYAGDDAALYGFKSLVKHEGILPALESSHAVAEAIRLAKELPAEAKKADRFLVHVSGRGDKDLFITAKHLDRNDWKKFLQQELERLQ